MTDECVCVKRAPYVDELVIGDESLVLTEGQAFRMAGPGPAILAYAATCVPTGQLVDALVAETFSSSRHALSRAELTAAVDALLAQGLLERGGCPNRGPAACTCSGDESRRD